MCMFGEGIRAGHHGSRPLFQLAQLLTSFIQRYPSTCQLAHHARRRPLHALDAARAWDVLGQTPRGLPGSDLTDWIVEERRRRQVKRGVTGGTRRAHVWVRHTQFFSVQGLSPASKETFEEPSVGRLWCLHWREKFP